LTQFAFLRKVLRPLDEYLSLQKRFSKMDEETKLMFRNFVVKQWNRLLKLEEMSPKKRA
jgi:hypothetical protein